MIAIKDMEMPKGCWYSTNLRLSGITTCPLKTYCSEKHIKEAPLDTRPSDCPLVEIVTCENCKHNGYSSVTRIYCKLHKWYPCSDYYCADGERRVNNG